MGIGLPEMGFLVIFIAGWIFCLAMLITAITRPKERFPAGSKFGWIVSMFLATLLVPLGIPAAWYFYSKVFKS